MKTRNLTLNQNNTQVRGLGAWSDQSVMEQHIGTSSGQSAYSPKQLLGQLGMHEWALC
jgi:hypothetical protein